MKKLLMPIICIMLFCASNCFAKTDKDMRVPLQGAPGYVECHKESDYSFIGKLFAYDGTYCGYCRSYFNGNTWWTDSFDSRGNCLESRPGCKAFFKDYFAAGTYTWQD